MRRRDGVTGVIEAGIHLLRKPIVIPANMEVAGVGIDQTLIRSQMLAPELILQLCAFSGGNCAVFTVPLSIPCLSVCLYVCHTHTLSPPLSVTLSLSPIAGDLAKSGARTTD